MTSTEPVSSTEPVTSTEPGGLEAGAGQEHLTSTEALARDDRPTGAPALLQTPSQTVGPFFGFALPFDGGAELVPAGAPGAIELHGTVLDGAGVPVPDALLELWQEDAAGRVPAEPGSRGRSRGRFTGFGRAAVDVAGEYEFRTVLPASGWVLVTVFARGLLHHLFTRAYLVADGATPPADALLSRLPEERARTLLAVQDGPGRYRFDVHLQGEHETVFLDYPGVAG